MISPTSADTELISGQIFHCVTSQASQAVVTVAVESEVQLHLNVDQLPAAV